MLAEDIEQTIMIVIQCCQSCYFVFNDTATTEIYTLSLHDALPIFPEQRERWKRGVQLLNGALGEAVGRVYVERHYPDRKSTRLNSSHANISYAVFCLKKKKTLTPGV